MKCKNCGANYPTRELKCPYCGTENLLGRIWMSEVTDAEIIFEQERAKAKKGLPLFVMNRVINRVLVLLGVIFFLFMIAFGIIDGGKELSYIIYSGTHKKEIEATLQQLYADEEWSELYTFMSDRKLFSTEGDYYKYSQAAFLANSYASFLEYKYAFYQLTDEEKMEDDHKLKYVIKKGIDTLQLDFGLYDEPQEEITSSETYKSCRADIASCFMGYLGMTKEELSDALSLEDTSGEEMDTLVSGIRERLSVNAGGEKR